ncbi:hypothetical protein [Neorhizobium sp. NCHU2750]|uniref:hypothetical protein n=1 Tax=Neorhizobium sp. NCHU2750 TaxID=1825976 RepID=UPI000E76BAB5
MSGWRKRTRISVVVAEAAAPFEKLIKLALRGAAIVIPRSGKPVAELAAIPKSAFTLDDIWMLAAEGRADVPGGAISSRDEHGLPR